MDTEQLEKELQLWNRCMYMTLGAAIAVVVSSFNDYSFAGTVWFLLQIATAPIGFFLLFSKRWRALPLTKERMYTIFGYLVASLLLLLIPGILGGFDDPLYFIFLVGYFVFLVVLYVRLQKKPSDSDEMFP